MDLKQVIRIELAMNNGEKVLASKVFLKSKNIKNMDDFKKELVNLKKSRVIGLVDSETNLEIEKIDEDRSIKNILIDVA